MLLLIIFSIQVVAENRIAVTKEAIADMLEQFSAESEVAFDYNSIYEELISISQNPINLNHTKREELERLAFLSDVQVESILAYLYQFGNIKTVYELQLIEGLDMTDIRRILPFIFVGEGGNENTKIYWTDVLKYGKQELLIRIDKGLEEKSGYLSEEEPSNQASTGNYLGNQFYTCTKYRFHYKDRIQCSFSAEKDAGEQFWGDVHKGYDFYSATLQLNNIGRIKTIVIGDFRANFGQGLVLHPDLVMGKSSFALKVANRNSGLKKYSSTDENNFFRGGGFSYQFGKIELSAFYSNKWIDGDTVNGSFPTWKKYGLHRTESEYRSKQTINQQLLGLNSTINFSELKLGFTLVHTALDQQLQSEKSTYNHFHFSGNHQTTAGLNYRIRLLNLNMFGEIGRTDKGAMASVNGVSFSPTSEVSLVALQRNYSPEYDSFYANAFSETSRVSNENGLYLAAEIRPFKQWKIVTAADSYTAPWPRFGMDAPSIGHSYFIQADYTAQRNLTMFWRYKYDEKQTNDGLTDAKIATLVPTYKSSLQYKLCYTVGNFRIKSICNVNFAQRNSEPITHGIIFAQDLSYSPISSTYSVDIRLQLFDAIHYENRFYSYEQDVLYAFSMPMVYGIGSRYYLNLRYNCNQSISVWFKIAQTVYADGRENHSTGNEMIVGNRKTDFRMLLKYLF